MMLAFLIYLIISAILEIMYNQLEDVGKVLSAILIVILNVIFIIYLL